MPQIAIEVMVSSALLDKLDVHAGLGVEEVWVWQSAKRRMVVHRLSGAEYTQHNRSAILADLDLTSLASFVRPGESHTALVKKYRSSLRRT